jgi:hypothetical protein
MNANTHTTTATLRTSTVTHGQQGASAPHASAAGTSERLRDAAALAGSMPRAVIATGASGLLMVLALVMMPWFHQASLEGGPASSIGGLSASHFKGLLILACGLLPASTLGLRFAHIQLGERLSRSSVVSVAGGCAVLLVTWVGLTPPEVLSGGGLVNGLASALGVGGIAGVLAGGAAPAAGVYVALIAAVGVCVGAQFMPGGPLAGARGGVPAGQLRAAVDILRTEGGTASFAPLVTGPMSLVLGIVGSIAGQSAFIVLGFLMAVATTVLALAARERLRAGGEELAPLARRQRLLAWAPAFLVIVVVVLSAIAVGHTAGQIASI